MDALIFDAVRSPRGLAKEEGALAQLPAIELLGPLFKALIERTGIDNLEAVEMLYLGIVDQVGEQGANLAKTALLYHGLPQHINGLTLNHFCCSGMTALQQACAMIQASQSRLVLAGGVESLSRVPIYSDKGPWYSDPHVAHKTGYLPPVAAADLLAALRKMTRRQLDTITLRSHHNALLAQKEGRFSSSIIPINDTKDKELLTADEGPREQLNQQALDSLKPIFSTPFTGQAKARLHKAGLTGNIQDDSNNKIVARHTVAHCPQQVDGAALLLVGCQSAGNRLGLRPRARIIAMASTCADPIIMITAHIDAAHMALKNAQLSADQIDLFEVNEGFASSLVEFQHQLNIPMDKINISGGAIALGHPLGATGAILVNTLLDDLERLSLRYGLAAIGGGAGVGTAVIIERTTPANTPSVQS